MNSPDSGNRISASRKRVLHVGCGVPVKTKLFKSFRSREWVEVRLDIDPSVRPTVVASMIDMKPMIADQTFDAVWSSHNIEHLDTHAVPKALEEFVRVLKPTGFALITCPDLAEVARTIVAGGIEEQLYVSPAGPITPLDVLFGHGRSIAAGNHFMRHNTGFTEERLGRVLVDAGFLEVRVVKGRSYDLWALALMPQCSVRDTQALFAESDLDFFRDAADGPTGPGRV